MIETLLGILMATAYVRPGHYIAIFSENDKGIGSVTKRLVGPSLSDELLILNRYCDCTELDAVQDFFREANRRNLSDCNHNRCFQNHRDGTVIACQSSHDASLRL
jgi:hypothetical protein